MAMLTRALSIGVVRKIAWGGDLDVCREGSPCRAPPRDNCE